MEIIRYGKILLTRNLDFDEHVDLEHSVISWCGRNAINGLMYGNGGLKCWSQRICIEYENT